MIMLKKRAVFSISFSLIIFTANPIFSDEITLYTLFSNIIDTYNQIKTYSADADIYYWPGG